MREISQKLSTVEEQEIGWDWLRFLANSESFRFDPPKNRVLR